MDHNPRTVVASVPVPGRRFVNRAGGLGGADVIGVSENDAVPGKPCSVITLGNAVVESAVELPAGAVVDTDADGRAVLASGIGLGVAERAAVAGGRVDVRLHGLPGVALQRVVSASFNHLTGGGIPSTFSLPRRGNIGMRMFGGRMEYPFNDGGTAKTHHTVFTTAREFDGVQIILCASNTASVPVTKLAVCPLPNATDLNGSALTWTAGTFAGSAAGTIPARVKNRKRTYLVSDIIPVSSVPRDDGGAYPLLAARAYLGTPGTYIMLNNSTASQNLSNWATHPSGRIHVMRYADGDCVATPASFADTTNRSTSPIVGIIYYARGRVVNVCGFGDSITEGQGTYKGEGWGFPLCQEMTGPDVAYEWSNFGWAGLTMAGSGATGGIHDQLTDAVAAGLPIDVAAFATGSPNDFVLSPPEITNALLNTQCRQPFARMLGAATGAGAVPVVWTWLPSNAAAKDYSATDALRIAHNEACRSVVKHVGPFVDTATALSGAVDADGQTEMLSGSTSDNIHPNGAGNALLVPVVKRAFAQIL